MISQQQAQELKRLIECHHMTLTDSARLAVDAFIDRLSADSVGAEPVAWIRDQRGEYEGPETLDPLFVLARPDLAQHGATYTPLFAAPSSAPAAPSAKPWDRSGELPAIPADVRPYITGTRGNPDLYSDHQVRLMLAASQQPAATSEREWYELSPPMLVLGRTYTARDGSLVTMKEIANAGTEYETMADQHGHHRYSRSHGRIIGRCTGSAKDDPSNIVFDSPPALAHQPAASQEGDGKDAARLDWLETMTVNVRVPLPYGSRDLFWSSPDDNDGLVTPSDIRAKIDAARDGGAK